MTKTFARCATFSAVVAALGSVVYTVTFGLVVQKGYRWAQWTSSVALLVGSLALVVVVIAARDGFAGVERQFAGVATAIGAVAALATATHAIYDIAGLAKPDQGGITGPFPTDPRGFATFALTGVALGLFGWLGAKSGRLDGAVRTLAVLAALCLIVVFVGRLAILNPKSNAVKPFAVASGLVLVPLTYLGFARAFSRQE